MKYAGYMIYRGFIIAQYVARKPGVFIRVLIFVLAVLGVVATIAFIRGATSGRHSGTHFNNGGALRAKTTGVALNGSIPCPFTLVGTPYTVFVPCNSHSYVACIKSNNRYDTCDQYNVREFGNK